MVVYHYYSLAELSYEWKEICTFIKTSRVQRAPINDMTITMEYSNGDISRCP